MPLPAALLERLKKRKIIQEAEGSSQTPQTSTKETNKHSTNDLHARYGHGEHSKQAAIVQQDDQEEIIAADYSDEEKSNPSSDKSDSDVDSDPSVSDNDQQSGDETQTQPGAEEEAQEPNAVDELEEADDDRVLNGSVVGCPNKYNIYHSCNMYCLDSYGDMERVGPSLEQRKQLALVLRSFPIPTEWSVVFDPGVKTFYFWNTVTDHVSWFPPSMNSFSTPSADHIRRTMRQLDEQVND